MNDVAPEFDFGDTPAAGLERVRFRLQRFEVFNWATFHQRVWRMEPDVESALLTGDIGSGKSTLVDALTTLLVPAQKASYNTRSTACATSPGWNHARCCIGAISIPVVLPSSTGCAHTCRTRAPY